MAINNFIGRYRYLSNFHSSEVEYEGLIYKSAEAAFQAAKVNMEGLDDWTKEFRKEFTELNPSEAKRKGRKVQLRTDWEEIKEHAMYEIVKSKFSRDSRLKRMLLSTNNEVLVEGNTWHDNYWGNCGCARCENIDGRNVLGNILMRVREEIK